MEQKFVSNKSFKRICRLTGQAIQEFDMIRSGDRILVGLSWGKDSIVLMHVLKHLQRRSPVKFELFSVWVDMGFGDYDYEALQDYADSYGWNYQVETLPGQQILDEKLNSDKPCSLCSRLRRGRIHAVADRLNCNVLAMGQHLDDLAVSLLMSMFRGGGIKTMGPHIPADSKTKRLIRPLCKVKEQLIINSIEGLELPIVKCCPYIDTVDEKGDRAYLENKLKELEEQFPDIREAMLASMQDVRPDHLMDRRLIKLPKEEK